jgi:hypothetical protein
MYPLGIWTSKIRCAIVQIKAGELMVMESEKRRVPRHLGALPVELEGGKSLTRDFSTSGIFFETDRSFSPGQPIEFTIVLEYADPAGPIQMKCRGEIVRVEESGHKIGVAATMDSVEFEALQPEKKSKERK